MAIAGPPHKRFHEKILLFHEIVNEEKQINSSETTNLITYAARQIKSIAGGIVQRHGYPPKDRRRKQLYILQGLPGVGAERAARLLDRFGSVEAVITANSGDLQSVEGIGENIAEKIKWAVSEQTQPFGIIDGGSI